jgi:hypothetical protein
MNGSMKNARDETMKAMELVGNVLVKTLSLACHALRQSVTRVSWIAPKRPGGAARVTAAGLWGDFVSHEVTSFSLLLVGTYD